MTSSPLSDIEHVRRRASMYLGSTGFFGLLTYFSSPINSLLARNPSHVSLTLESGTFRIEGDVDLAMSQDETGVVLPFERFRKEVGNGGCEPIVTALSSSLVVDAVSSGTRWELAYVNGHRTSLAATDDNGATRCRLTFAPDASIFTVESISHYNFHSYFRRLSYLCPHVRFDLTIDGTATTYHAPAGIRDMLDAVSAPYQLLHEPVYVHKTIEDLDLECVFAFHNGTNDWVWSFVNRTWASDGGTHAEGFIRGLEEVRVALDMPEGNATRRNGILGIMSLTYPKIVWQGCRRSEIHDPFLRLIVREMVAQGSLEWLRYRPEIKLQLHELIPFQFPDGFLSR